MENNTFLNNSDIQDLNDDGILDWTRYTLIGFMVLVTIIGIPGNIIVIAVLTKFRMNTSTDYFILTMAGIDLFSAAVNTSCFIVRYEPTAWKILASVIICRLHIFSIFITNISTTLLLAATAFDRYRKTKSISTADTPSVIIKARRICVGIMISGFIYGITYTFTVTLDTTSRKCVLMDGYRIVAVMFSSILALVFVFMFVIVIVCYTRVTIILRRHHRQLFQQNTDKINTPMSIKICNKKSRIQPINQDINLPSTSKVNSSYNEFDSKETVLQNEPNRTLMKSRATTSKNHGGERKSNDVIGHLIVVKSEDSDHDLEHSQGKESVNCEVGSDRNICFKTKPPSYNACSINVIQRVTRDTRRKMINITTLMMFLITLIYVTTWSGNWSAQITKTATKTPSVNQNFLIERLYMINCITNPILFIILSSKFRQKAKELFCRS